MAKKKKISKTRTSKKATSEGLGLDSKTQNSNAESDIEDSGDFGGMNFANFKKNLGCGG